MPPSSVVDKERTEQQQIYNSRATHNEEEMPVKRVDSPRPVNSSSRPIRQDNNDNMRGFDPASEDDMDDNGMSRYMENDDDEGWD